MPHHLHGVLESFGDGFDGAHRVVEVARLALLDDPLHALLSVLEQQVDDGGHPFGLDLVEVNRESALQKCLVAH